MKSFEDRYRLLKCVALAGGIRTHNAQETSSGRPVMVHILDSAEPEAVRRLREQVDALSVPDRSRILEMSATDGGVVVVSEILIGLKSFPDWLEARGASAAPAAPASPAQADAVPTPEDTKSTRSFAIGKVDSSDLKSSKSEQQPGEFTRMFQGADASSAPKPQRQPEPTPVAPAPAPAPPVATPAPPPQQAPLRPGEFTSLFQPMTPPPGQQAGPSPLLGRQSPSAGHSPEQYRPPQPLGGSSSAAFVRPDQAAPVPGPALGSLDSFGSLGGPRDAAPPAPASGAPPPLPPAPLAPMALGSSPLGSSPLGSSPLGEAPQSPLGAVGPSAAPLPRVIAPPVFAGPAAAGGVGPAASRSPLADNRAAGPSDYTMLIRQSATPAPQVVKPAASAPTAQPPAPRKSLPLGLLIALNVVLLLAIVLVLYFVFRPAPPDAVPNAAPGAAVPKVPGAPAVKAPAAPKIPAVPNVKP